MLQAYTDWMKGLLKSMPDGRYVLISSRSIKRQNVSAHARFFATHTGEGGPCPPTGKNTKTDYVHIIEFEGDRICHMTKVGNSGWAMRELGWCSDPTAACAIE
jgi:hypothetical protein